MPAPSPFHSRTQPLCRSYAWKDWAGYAAVCTYDSCHEPEYYAVRQTCAVLDVTPLHKYEIAGADAAEFLAFLTVRDVRALKAGRVSYLCWCDDDGKLLDDGTVTVLGDGRYRLTASLPQLHWLSLCADGFDVEITDVSDSMAALALQGPRARDVLADLCQEDVSRLRFFRHRRCTFGDDIAGELTRTGYTGDLGYELWVDAARAEALWDALFAVGPSHGLLPMGLDALDMLRIEAGFVLQGVDYRSARVCLIEGQRSSPFEMGLGWTVDLERDDGLPFVGQAALRREAARGSRYKFVGLEVSWAAIEALYDAYGLPPARAAAAWRHNTPVYVDELQVGYATSGTWSPLLKAELALAHLETRYAEAGSEVAIEMTVEYGQRRRVMARVAELPFFDPARKRAIPAKAKATKKAKATAKKAAAS
ncbi:MAG: aminomethyltransferase family protein [Myxococcales bacterium]|nr:aminomethyltransferase family protein [Myxococcales bacterium]